MAGKIHRLKNINHKTPGYYSDGGGLTLQVTIGANGNVNRSWVYRYMVRGKAHKMGLGSCNDVTIAEAREKARQIRATKDGRSYSVDPLQGRRERELERAREQRAAVILKQATAEYIEAHRAQWTNEIHAKQWVSSMDKYILPKLGNHPTASIDEALINATLSDVLLKTPETGRRTRGRALKVIEWIAKGKPIPEQKGEQKHFEALPWAEVPAFMSELRQREEVQAKALEWTILTACRSGDTFGATWDEIDRDAKVWTIPAERFKTRKEMRIPLSNRALQILDSLPREVGNPLVFIGTGRNRGLGADAMLDILVDIRPGLTVHGFRSTFRDWTSEATNTPRDVAEMALGHKIKGKTEAAYRRGDLLEKRAVLMEQWSDYCGTPVDVGNVIAMRA